MYITLGTYILLLDNSLFLKVFGFVKSTNFGIGTYI